MKSRVYVAGTGVISAIGNSLPETWNSFQQHRSGIGTITLFDSVHKGVLPVGEVKLSNDQLSAKANVEPTLTRTSLLGIIAAREALTNAGLPSLKHLRTGLISATTVGGMDKTENFFGDFLKDPGKGRLRDVVNHECGAIQNKMVI